jgi:hypothetical protein
MDIERELINELAENGTDKARNLFIKWQEQRINAKQRLIKNLTAVNNNCDLADVGGSAVNIDELLEKMNKIRNDEAFKGVLSFDYPNEILEVIDALEKLR